jgi:hypothetical protein
MTIVRFHDRGGQPVVGAVVVITAAPDEQADLGYVTDEEGAISLSIAMPGTYGFLLTDALGSQLTAHAELSPDADASVRAQGTSHSPPA